MTTDDKKSVYTGKSANRPRVNNLYQRGAYTGSNDMNASDRGNTGGNSAGFRTQKKERPEGARQENHNGAVSRYGNDGTAADKTAFRSEGYVRPKAERNTYRGDKCRNSRANTSYAKRRPVDQASHAKQSEREDVARMLAFKALQDVFRDGAYSSLALNARLRESSASPEDKRLATAIFYEAVENRMLISYILRQFAERVPDGIIEDIFHIAIAQIMFMDRIPVYSAVDEAVKMTRRLGRDEQSGFVNGVLRSLLRAKDSGTLEMPDESVPYVRRMSVRCSVPETLVARLMEAYGEDFTTEMLNWKPDERIESVRANSMLISPEEFEAYCEKKKWIYEKGLLEGFVLVKGAGDLAGDPDFRRGLYSVQGVGSALAALAVGARPGMQILDACSAPGGKTCLMAERMGGAGRILAWDVHEHRVELVKAAARRLGLENIRPAVHDASQFKPDMENTMDAVLIDAPCSGLGVMINKPDVKYNYKDAEIKELVLIQKSILSACARYVKVGGTLVYSTCTVIPDENSSQIEHFLRTHGDYVPDGDCSFLPETLRKYWHDGTIQLHAHRDGTEGFFIAKLKRIL